MTDFDWLYSCPALKSHRIPEWFELEGTIKLICHGQEFLPLCQMLRAPYNLWMQEQFKWVDFDLIEYRADPEISQDAWKFNLFISIHQSLDLGPTATSPLLSRVLSEQASPMEHILMGLWSGSSLQPPSFVHGDLEKGLWMCKAAARAEVLVWGELHNGCGSGLLLN